MSFRYSAGHGHCVEGSDGFFDESADCCSSCKNAGQKSSVVRSDTVTCNSDETRCHVSRFLLKNYRTPEITNVGPSQHLSFVHFCYLTAYFFHFFSQTLELFKTTAVKFIREVGIFGILG